MSNRPVKSRFCFGTDLIVFIHLIFIYMLYAILIGALAGWLAGRIMRNSGFGIIVNILLGILGGFLANWLFGYLHISIGSGVLSDLITGVIGAIVILFIARLIKK